MKILQFLRDINPAIRELVLFQASFYDEIGGDLNGQFMAKRLVVAFLN
jgi:hypothetical protein